jgi:hypothetical protein
MPLLAPSRSALVHGVSVQVCKHNSRQAETFRCQLSLVATAGGPPEGHMYLPLHGRALPTCHRTRCWLSMRFLLRVAWAVALPNVTPCIVVELHWRFGGIYGFQPLGPTINLNRQPASRAVDSIYRTISKFPQQ